MMLRLIAGPKNPAVDQPGRRRYLGEDGSRILQPGQIAAQRRMQGAHEADVGWCLLLAQPAAGSQADHARNHQPRTGYRSQNPATTSGDLACHTLTSGNRTR